MKLIIDRVPVSRIKSFSYDSEKDVLSITAAGEAVTPDMEEQEPKPDPEPESPSNVIRGYDFDITGERQRKITIPASGILASRFVAPAEGHGKVSFQIPTGEPTPMTRYWISETPGGAPVSDDAEKTKNFIYNMSWVVGIEARGRVTLQPGKPYYFNMQHDPVLTRSSVAERFAQ